MLVIGTARCQDAPARAPNTETYSAPPVYGSPLPTPMPHEPSGYSSYITYTKPGCCGPVGGHGPIMSELYLRAGPSLPVSGGTLAHTLQTGWEIQGGGRSLFFNSSLDAAWTVDLSIGNIYNNGNRPNLAILFQGVFPTTVQALNRTFVSAGVGREWYLLAPAESQDTNWRVGADVGGRMGSARLDLNDATTTSGYRRLNDVLGAVYLSLHTDAEFPCGGFTFLAGFRAEWDYTWMDIYRGPKSDIVDVNLLVTTGVRY